MQKSSNKTPVVMLVVKELFAVCCTVRIQAISDTIQSDPTSATYSKQTVMAGIARKEIKAILFDLDGTLLDTEALSDKAILQAFGDSLPDHIRQERHLDGDRLPWEIKSQILGKRGEEWVPMVIAYAQENWGVAGGGGAAAPTCISQEASSMPLPPSV